MYKYKLINGWCLFMKKRYSNILKFLIILSVNIYVLSFAVKFTLYNTALYSYDIGYLRLEEKTNLTRVSIESNYNAVVNYIKDKNVVDLHLPSLAMSESGRVHFYEVKNIFLLLNNINIISAIMSLLLIFIFFYYKDFSFLKISSISLAVFPIFLGIPFLINFDGSFIFFHKILFNNSYWEFDPSTDPIINILPQEFFFHCIMLIVFIMFVFSIIFALVYFLIKKRRD